MTTEIKLHYFYFNLEEKLNIHTFLWRILLFPATAF